MTEKPVEPVTVPSEGAENTQTAPALVDLNTVRSKFLKDNQELLKNAGVQASQVRVPSEKDVQKLPKRTPEVRKAKFAKLSKEQQDLVTKANEAGLAVVLKVDGKDFGFMPTEEQHKKALTANSTTNEVDAAKAEADNDKFSWSKWWENNSWWLKPLLWMLLGSAIGYALHNAIDKRDHPVAANTINNYEGGLGDNGGNGNGGNGGNGNDGNGGNGNDGTGLGTRGGGNIKTDSR